MWTIAVYHQVSLFSLGGSLGTSTGGKSLLVPSPYSVRMALLDATIRAFGVQEGLVIFPLLRDMAIALHLPQHILVNNCFVRIHKPRRRDGQKGQKVTTNSDFVEETVTIAEDSGAVGDGQGFYINSVAFREYVQYGGPLGIALQGTTQDGADHFARLLPLINYFGKRGGFFQLDSLPTVREQLPERHHYLRIDQSETPAVTSGSVLQVLDDWSPQMTFDQVNVYSPAFALGKDRVQHHITLPYHITRSSHGFTLYQRSEGIEPERKLRSV
jgi:hypothetical protein